MPAAADPFLPARVNSPLTAGIGKPLRLHRFPQPRRCDSTHPCFGPSMAGPQLLGYFHSDVVGRITPTTIQPVDRPPRAASAVCAPHGPARSPPPSQGPPPPAPPA